MRTLQSAISGNRDIELPLAVVILFWLALAVLTLLIGSGGFLGARYDIGRFPALTEHHAPELSPVTALQGSISVFTGNADWVFFTE